MYFFHCLIKSFFLLVLINNHTIHGNFQQGCSHRDPLHLRTGLLQCPQHRAGTHGTQGHPHQGQDRPGLACQRAAALLEQVPPLAHQSGHDTKCKGELLRKIAK
jgi:hypothetical protein